MEFDILNEIITGSVAQLFTDLHKHANYMKTSSQMGQDKSDIPRQSLTSTIADIYAGGSSGSKSDLMMGDSPVA